MEILENFIFVVHIVISILLVITVLLQPGRGGDLGSMFGGTSESVFGASGAVPFLAKVTRVLAVIFMVTSLSLGYFSAKGVTSSVVEDSPPAPVEQREESATTEETKTAPQSEGGTQPEQESAPSQGGEGQTEVQKPVEETGQKGAGN